MGRNVSLLPRAKEGRSEDVSGPTVDALCRQRQPQAAHSLGFHVVVHEGRQRCGKRAVTSPFFHKVVPQP
jgi:hypothetical protein